MSVNSTNVATAKKRHASNKQKANGIKLWNSVKNEVYLTDEFNPEGELKVKADKYLHALKIKVWRISLAKGNVDDAMKIVFGYNKAVNDLLAEKMEPVRTDFIENVPVAVATGGVIRSTNISRLDAAHDVKVDALSIKHVSIGDIVKIQWEQDGEYFNYEVQPDCETLHIVLDA